MAWIFDHWKDLLLALLAVDAALIPIFPNAGILKTILDLGKKLAGQAPSA
jgi:hypothetical protein